MTTEFEESTMASTFDHRRPVSPLRQSQPSKPRGGLRLLSFLLQAVVMAVALSAFFFFAGVAAVILLHLLLAGRSLRRRRRYHQRSLRNPNPSGLSPGEIEALPLFVFSDEIKTLTETSVEDCAVCLEMFREGERCRSLPSCGHCFHEVCVDRWLVRTPACPICRGGVDRPEIIATV